MSQTASTAIFINKHRPRVDEKCPISIRDTCDRIRKYYPTKYNLTMDEYNRMTGKRPGEDLKKILLELQELEKKAAGIINKLPVFTFPAFEKSFLTNRGLSATVNDAFDEYINILN